MEHLPLVENHEVRLAVARKDRVIKLFLGGALFVSLIALVSVSIILGTQIQRLSEKPVSTEHDRSDDFPLRTPDPWDITENHARKLTFTTTEGTWLNVDVSPDGKTILFDMLGDLYTMPIAGGQATAVRAGVSFDTQPRYSPSGALILFTSDQGGCDNIWVMNAATGEAWPVTTEPYHFVSNAWWSSETTVLAVKWYTSERSLGGGEIWSYEIGSRATNTAPGFVARGTRLVGRTGAGVQVGPEEPVAGSDDGKTLFYSKNTADSFAFQYSKDPHAGIYSIFKHDIATGAEAEVASGPGGAARPVLNRARTLLAFIRRTKWKTSLMLKDLKTGNEKILWDGLDFDQQESYAPSGVYPSFAFTPDDTAVIVWSKGQIWRVETASGRAGLIPFTATIALDLAPTLRFTQNVASNSSADGFFTTKVAVSPVADGASQRVLFESLGGIWSLDLTNSNANPQLLVDQDDHVLQSNPALTTAGDWFGYVQWNDLTLAQMFVAKTADTSKRWPIPENYPGRYSRIAFSPKGDKIAYIRLGGDSQSGSTFSNDAGVYWRSVNLAGAEPAWGSPVGPISGRHATFSSTGEYVFVVEGEYPKTQLWRYSEATPSQRFLVATSIYATDIRVSPDQKYIAFIEFRKLYIAPFNLGNARSSAGPFNATAMAGKPAGVKLVYSRGVDYLSWSTDGSKLRWGWASEFFEIDAAKCIASSTPSSLITSWDLSISTQAAIAPTFVVFDNATVITMDADLGIIPDGRVIVRNGRIQAIGKASEIDIPTQAQVVDVEGGTILPGFIDAHAHWNGAWGAEYKVKNSWEFLVNLAFGVTTLHNPSADTASIFRDAELVRSGAKVGPRLTSTGTIIYGAGGDIHCDISSYDDAYDFLYQLKQMGAWSVKSYNQPCRSARQRVLAAAKDLKMSVVPEGGMAFWWNLNQIIDGHTTIEHALPMAPLYNDVIKLFAQSGTAWTPTFIVNYGGIFGERYWYQNTKVFDDERLMTYAPEDTVYPQTIRRVGAEDVDYHHFVTAQSVKAIFEQGGNVLAGAHGEMQGLGYHWEIRMFAQGNMSNYDVLKAATINPAKAHGLDHEIGSLKVGKLADLIFFKPGESPLDDIWNAAKVRWVMKDGFMWDASRGMAQVLPVAKAAPKLPQLNTPRI